MRSFWESYGDRVYWLIPLCLWIVQYIYSVNSINQVRYEELAESVRNAYWLDGGLVYDGISRNVIWYGAMVLWYKLVGFEIFAGTWFRLVLSAISYISLSSLLWKLLGKRGWLPLLVIGLSPTLLVFSTQQTAFASDLQLLPLLVWVVWLSVSIDVQIRRLACFLSGAGLVMSLFTYGSFLFYFPVFGLALIWLHWERVGDWRRWRDYWVELILAIAGGLLPLWWIWNHFSNWYLLWDDPDVGTKLFGSNSEAYVISGATFGRNWDLFWKDFFVRGSSFYAEIVKPEFSDMYPLAGILLVFVASVYLFREKKHLRIWIGLLGFLMLWNFVVTVGIVDPDISPPGLRRNTPLIAGFYGFLVVVWNYWDSIEWGDAKKWLAIGVGSLVAHHLLVMPINLQHMQDLSPYRYGIWLSPDVAETPDKAFGLFMDKIVREDIYLKCDGIEKMETFNCRYQEIYSAVKGKCEWEDLDCKEMYGFDPELDEYRLLQKNLWSEYVWPH